MQILLHPKTKKMVLFRPVAQMGHYKVPFKNLKVTIKWLLENGYSVPRHWCGTTAISCQAPPKLKVMKNGTTMRFQADAVRCHTVEEFKDVFEAKKITCDN
mmetsp:Transcript_23411/g.41402  ORF Transcript_23411/g.41402 Transcript_23411/m.41402 type:complete len:101 (+) Transcript_23411:583-885(+)